MQVQPFFHCSDVLQDFSFGSFITVLLYRNLSWRGVRFFIHTADQAIPRLNLLSSPDPFLKGQLKDMHQEGFENPGPLALPVFDQTLQFPEDMRPAKGMVQFSEIEIATPAIMHQSTAELIQDGWPAL